LVLVVLVVLQTLEGMQLLEEQRAQTLYLVALHQTAVAVEDLEILEIIHQIL